MSLKLDELRKRLLQQSATPEAGARDARASEVTAATGRVVDALTARGAESPFAARPRVQAATIDEAPVEARPIVAPTPKPSEAPVAQAAPASPESSKVPESAPLPAPSAPEPMAPRVAESASLPAEAHEAAASHDGPASSNAEAPASAAPTNLDGQNPNELSDAVAKVFEPTKALQIHFDDLTRTFEQVERMGNSAARVFAPLRAFHQQMQQVAR